MSKPKKKTAAKVGRPSKFDPRHVEEAMKLAQLGATDKEMAEFWGVSVPTFYAWQKAHPEFLKALKLGKMGPDMEVAASLYQRATGYSHAAVKIFMPSGAESPVYADYTERYPPDTTSMIFWLKNRRPDLWRDKLDVDQKHSLDPDAPASPLEVARQILFALRLAAQGMEGQPAQPEKPGPPALH